MDLELKAMIGAVHLFGVVATLRRMYQPPRQLPDPIRIALTRIERNERPRSPLMTSPW